MKTKQKSEDFERLSISYPFASLIKRREMWSRMITPVFWQKRYMSVWKIVWWVGRLSLLTLILAFIVGAIGILFLSSQ